MSEHSTASVPPLEERKKREFYTLEEDKRSSIYTLANLCRTPSRGLYVLQNTKPFYFMFPTDIKYTHTHIHTFRSC